MVDCADQQVTETTLIMSEDNTITTGLYIPNSGKVQTIPKWNPIYNMEAYKLGFTCIEFKVDRQEVYYEGYWTINQVAKNDTPLNVRQLWWQPSDDGSLLQTDQGVGFYLF
jgi:hypothetical protein